MRTEAGSSDSYSGTFDLVGRIQQFPNGEIHIIPMYLTFENGIMVDRKYGPSWPLKSQKELARL
jgi:hypothetical protein